jgi:hypothetical protein
MKMSDERRYAPGGPYPRTREERVRTALSLSPRSLRAQGPLPLSREIKQGA